MWLRDFLPEVIPTARILIYGYDSKLKGSKSFASIHDFAKRFLDEVKTVRGDPTVSPHVENRMHVHKFSLDPS
jgi:hypothetical protein